MQDESPYCILLAHKHVFAEKSVYGYMYISTVHTDIDG